MQTCVIAALPKVARRAVSTQCRGRAAFARRVRARVRYRVLCVHAFVCMCTSGCPSSPGPASESTVHATWLPWSEPRRLRVAGAAAPTRAYARRQLSTRARTPTGTAPPSGPQPEADTAGQAASSARTHARIRAHAALQPPTPLRRTEARRVVRLALRVLSAGARVRPGRDGVSTEARTWARRTLHDCGRPGKPGSVPITGSESDGPYLLLGSSANPRFAKV